MENFSQSSFIYEQLELTKAYNPDIEIVGFFLLGEGEGAALA